MCICKEYLTKNPKGKVKMLKSKFIKTVLFSAVAAVSAGTVNAQDAATPAAEEATGFEFIKLNTVNVDYTSKYVWRGFELFGANSAYQPSVDMALLGDSGLGLNVWGSFPNGSGAEAFTELDYTLYYAKSFGEEETQIDFGANYIYFDYPKLGSNADVQEGGVSFGMPNLLPLGVGMKYYVAHGWATESGSGLSYNFHSFTLTKSVELSETYALNFFGDVNYNEDMFYDGSDWTHTTTGVNLSGIAIESLSLTPFIAYQSSMVDEPTITDTLFGGLKASYAF